MRRVLLRGMIVNRNLVIMVRFANENRTTTNNISSVLCNDYMCNMKRKSTLVDSVSAEPEVSAVGRKRLSSPHSPLSTLNSSLLTAFAVLLCLLFGSAAWGQSTVEWGNISDNSGTTSYTFSPYGRHYGWEYRVYCYRPNTLPFSGEITSMAFLAATDYSTIGNNTSSSITINGSSDSNPLQIWMKEVSGNYALSGDTYFSEYVSGATKVYSGNNPATTSGSYNTFTLSAPFVHSQENSLLILVRTVANETSGCGAHECYYKELTGGVALSWFNKKDSSDPGISAWGGDHGTYTNNLPVLRLTYTSSLCTTLTSPADGADISTASPTLQWDAVAGATSYHVYLSNTTTKPAQYSYSTNSTSVTASNILYGVTYCWVVPCDGNGELISCGDYTQFRRTCPASVTAPTITADVDLNNLTCGQTVTLTANGEYSDYRWYSDAACTTQVGSGQTYSFQAGSSPITIYCKSACVASEAVVGSQNFAYTGSVQTYNVPSGVQSLTLEVWGAQGGNNSVDGGKGGYSVGVLNNLSGISNLYVYVGQQSTSTAGGWNGGGGMTSYGKGGGGATDISLHNYTYNTTDHYNDRIIVAGGGGGAGYSSCYGGYGGGETGGAGTAGSYAGGGGGTQTSGGSCYTSDNAGLFGSASTNSSHNGGGGGGGWYGGGAGQGGGTDSGAGGGSGFVWTSTTASNVPTGYNVSSSYYLIDAQTIAGNTSFPAPNGGTETGHEGNGYARISYVIPAEASLSSATSITTSAAPAPATPTVSVASACPGEDVVLTVTNAVNGLTYGWWDNSSCTGDPLHEGTTYTIDNMQNNATYYVRAYNGSLNPVHNFDYTGAEQTLTVPSSVSSVTLEVWGAQGGGQPFVSNSQAGVGGLGGYSIGTMSVQGNETLHVYVGGHGGSSGDGTGRGEGGWNGGGCTYTSSSGDPANGGGGATDIRLNGTTYYDRIIVAGGGGGGGEDGEQGGYGGGLTGFGSYSATQTSAGNGGVFGAGAHTGYDGGGAGGGWYGGGAANGSQTIPNSDTDSDNNGGSGGSGYVWTSATASNAPSGYNVSSSYYLTDAQTIAGNTSFPAPGGGNETGHTGNGYARITFNVAAPTCMSAIGTVAVELGTPPTFTLTADNSVSCNQTPVTFTINNPSNGIVRYEWSDGVNTTETTSTTYTVTPGSTTTYTVSAYNAYCSANQSYTVSVDAPEVTIEGSDNGDCIDAGTEVTLYAGEGECPSSVNMSSTTIVLAPGCSFTYYDHNGSSSDYTNYEDYTQTFTSGNGTPVTIRFSSIGAESCCDYMYLYDGPDASGTSLYGSTLYNLPTNTEYTANSGSLTVRFTSDVSNVGSGWVATVSCAAYNYAWHDGSTGYSVTVTPTESTTYTLTVTADGYVCPAIKEYTVHVNPTPEISPMNPMVCAGRTITLTASGADEYHWNNGALTTDITVDAGTYTVTGTNSDGCYAEASTTVTSLSTPSAGAIADMEVCQSDAVITLASTTHAVGGGNVEYSWTINNNITTDWSSSAETYTLTDANRTALGTGTFNVVRNFRDGCENSGSTTATLTINPPMDAPTVNGLASIYCGQTTTLTASTSVSGNIHYRWYSDPAGQDLVYEGNDFTTPALDATTTYYVQSVELPVIPDPINFSYTGSEQSYTIPADVTEVQLEVWGAQGGGSQTYDNGDDAGSGGKGGYSIGTMSVVGGETLYIYVGGEGDESSGFAQGGFNGGGSNYGSSTGEPACGGGGATDMRLNGNTLYDRIIVAGGGGGGGEDSSDQGGYGGGLTGGPGNAYSYQGTQTDPGTGAVFGIGASAGNDGGAGGGGWYGGGTYGGSQTIPSSGSGSDSNGGSGGSGYVWTSATASSAPSGYNVPSSYYLTDAQTIDGNTSFPAPGVGNEIGHAGNGYARITITEMLPSTSNCPSELVPVTITVNTPPTPIVEVRSACIGTPSELEVVNPIDGFTYQWSTVSDFSTIEARGVTFITTINSQTTYYVRSVAGSDSQIIDFDYTGSEQSYTIPAGVSKVQLEVWGAQGGNASVEGSYMGAGGAGGYSKGLYSVSEGNTLYVVVGGQGTSSTSITSSGTLQGGYNGGGNSMGGDTYCAVAAGGGATHISTTSGVLSSLSPSSVIIVAGGGGGAGTSSNSSYTQYGTGGYGGGVSGGTGISGYASYSPGGGGTQSQGGSKCPSSDYSYEGSFGQGGNQTGNSGGWGAGAGGGGYYGGGSGGALGATGGGGSGYIGGVTSGETHDGSETFLAPDGTDEIGHSDNGYARITLLDIDTDYCPSPTATVTINPVDPPTFSFTTSGSSYCYGDDAVVLTVVPSSNITGYQWSDGATTTEPTHEVTPGHTTRYAVTVTNGTCAIASQEIIIAVDAPEVTLIGSDNGECVVSGTEVTLNANNDESSIKASEYLFSSRTETFQSFSGGTSCNTGDDYATSNVPIGFTFNYCGIDCTSITNVNTNGVLQFGYSSASNGNDLNSSSYYNVIAPFWDDLVASTYQYRTTGDAPNRVFELQFYGYRYNNSSYYFYYQVKLYEGSNMIEFCYGSSGYSSLGSNASASIGINSYIDGELSFLSVTPTGAGTATYSTSSANNSVAGSASLHNTVYTFTPIQPANYQWAVNGTTLVGEETESLTVSPVESTTYTLTVTNSEHGCPAIWDYTVKVLPTPSLTTDESPICLGAEATLTAGGAGTNGTYNWGEGYVSENTNVVLPTNNTTYRVTVKNVNGCTASSYVDQEVQMAPGNTPMTHVVQGHIWTGRVSSDWDDSRNWLVFTGGGSGYTIAANAPTSSDPVVVRTGATCINNEPSVNANSTANNVIIRDGRTLTVEGSRTLAVNGDIDIENGGELTFSGSGMVSVTGDANIASGASVTFGNKDTLNVAGAFELNGSMVFPDRDTTPALRLGGNLTINNGSSLGTYGTLVFAGNGPQVVENNTTDTLRVRNNVRLNMHHSRAGVPHTEFPDGTIFSKATIFEYGIMDGDVIFDGTGRAIVCGGYESYASGRIEKRGSGNKFTFPTGDDNVLGSVTATISSGKKAYAKFHHWSGDNGDGSHGFGLDVIPRWWNVADMCGEDPFNHVSNFEYWDVSSREELSDVMLMTNAATSAEHFGDESAFVDADIQVAAYKNGCWSNYGGTATISDPDHNVIIIEGARIPIDPHRAAADFLITLGSKSNATVLPIELASVTATCDGRSTLIEWTTATERNNDYFSLERSDDAINFVEIARIAGAGNSIDPVDYAYTDYVIHGGDNYYRLVQVDYDGTRTASEIIVVNCIDIEVAEPDVQAYPNPFNGELTLVLDNFSNRAATIEVYDMLGKLIYTNKVAVPQNSYETILNLSNLPPAAYTVRVSTNDFVINRNVVKQ